MAIAYDPTTYAPTSPLRPIFLAVWSTKVKSGVHPVGVHLLNRVINGFAMDCGLLGCLLLVHPLQQTITKECLNIITKHDV